VARAIAVARSDRVKVRTITGQSLAWASLCALACAVALGLLGNILVGRPTKIFFFALMLASLPMSALIDVSSGILRGLEEFFRKALLDVGKPLIFLAGIILANTWHHSGLSVPVFSYVAAAGITAVVGLGFLFANGSFTSVAFPAELFRYGLPLTAGALAGVVMGCFDTLFLGVTVGALPVASYAAAMSLASLVGVVAGSFDNVFLPRCAYLLGHNRFDELSRTYRFAINASVLSNYPLVFVLIAWAGEVLQLTFGPEYRSAAFLLQILALSNYLNNLLGPNHAGVKALGRSDISFRASMLIIGLKVLLGVLLIPYYGAAGAAVAYFVSQLSFNVYLRMSVKRLCGSLTMSAQNVLVCVLVIVSVALSSVAGSTTSLTLIKVAAFLLPFVAFLREFRGVPAALAHKAVTAE
jgi:O-antigen/teichoic acid export membrane protein